MWTLGLIQVQRVKFDQDRWTDMVPKFIQFWDDVLALRASGTPDLAQPQPQPGRVVGTKHKEKVVQFVDSDDSD
jgi:hypothetical protein